MRRSSNILVALAAIFMIGGFASFANAFLTMRSWQGVTGEVTYTDLATFTKRGKEYYRGELIARYVVNDRVLRVPASLSRSHTTREEAKRELDGLTPGNQVRLYYNPKDPADMLLDVTAHPRFFALPAVVTLIGIICSALSIASILKMKCFCPGCAASVELWDKFCYACRYRLPKQKKMMRL
jgi:hypothetical protein